MKNLRLLIVSMMLSYSCLCATELEPKSEYQRPKLRSLDSEANIYARESADIYAMEEGLNAKNIKPIKDDDKRTSTLSDYVASGRNIITHPYSVKVICVASVLMGAYFMFTRDSSYCSQSFVNTDENCMNLVCLDENKLQESYSICKDDKLCWKENRGTYQLCFNKECWFAPIYCNTVRPAIYLAFIIVTLCLYTNYYRYFAERRS